MNILFVHNHPIPVSGYGGVERIIWWLGKEYVRLGHRVAYLVPAVSSCPFGRILHVDPAGSLNAQIPPETDVVHLCYQSEERPDKPYLMMYQYNHHPRETFDINTVFISQDHARRHHSETYVYNGIDIEEYGDPALNSRREHLLFLGYAKRPEKNLADCLRIARRTKNILAVVGGKDKWYRRRPWVRYKGFLGGEEKLAVLRASKALLFPVRWHEPFGIAVIEALYFGAPVVASPYGSLKELVGERFGCATTSLSHMIETVKRIDAFDRKKCHDYVCDRFNSRTMAADYIKLYEKVMNGKPLNAHEPVNNGNFSRERLLPLTP
jgi:glycosyltransferase involved in cell wall biosynthesis